MLCLSGFELHSRWVPLTVWRLYKRNVTWREIESSSDEDDQDIAQNSKKKV